MSIARVFDVLLAIVGVAMATTIFSSPNTSSVVQAFGNAFSGSLRASLGH